MEVDDHEKCHVTQQDVGVTALRPSSFETMKGEVLSLEDVDPAMDAKMHLVNNVRPLII